MKYINAELLNLLLAVPFIYAILRPEQNLVFIYDTSVMIFIVEFLSIHSSAMLVGKTKISLKNKLLILVMYSIVATAILIATKSYLLLAFFLISLLTKLFIHKNTSVEKTFVKPMIVLLATTFFVIIFSGLLAFLIPLPEEVLNYKDANAGLFGQVPQTILVWGIIYSIGLYLISFVNIPIKEVRTRTRFK